ncbi:MAG TPA: sugar phosphate isomerase/epimerase family protein [Anseongella sp.]|nr:sugar phosphate isomerase/epimerase family protein [Anseongella sp.]
MRKKICSLAASALIAALLPASLKAQEVFNPELGVTGSLDNIPLLVENGFTFIQPSVGAFLMPGEPEEKFEENLKKYEDAPVNIFACNSFIPKTLKSVGPDYAPDTILKYADKVFERAAKAGVEVIVFGSGGSREIPRGFSKEEATRQFIALGKKMAPLAGRHGVVICLENLNSTETNMINTFNEAYQVVKAIDHPNFRLTVDIYHMLKENESPAVIREAAEYIYHCDLAEKKDRTAPGVKGDDFRPYFRALKEIGYKGKIAIECRWEDMAKQLPAAMKTLKEQLATL